MWDVHNSFEQNCREQLVANNRWDTRSKIVSSIFDTYYSNVNRPIIVDKCRSWTLPANMQLVKNYLDPKPKIIVLTRNIDEIVKSFADLHERNNKTFNESDLFIEGSEPLMRSLDGVNNAKANNGGEFLFIDYSDLVRYTDDVMVSVYNFCELDYFEHDLTNIVNAFPEDDSVYGLPGMHEVRLTPCFRQNG